MELKLKCEVKEELPYEEGYYYTDKGTLFFCAETQSWCTHEHRKDSYEYPEWYLLDVSENLESDMFMCGFGENPQICPAVEPIIGCVGCVNFMSSKHDDI